MPDDTAYWVAFHRVPQLGSKAFAALERAFGSLHEAWEGSAGALQAAGLPGKLADTVVEKRRTIAPAAELERLERLGVVPLPWNHPQYPARLKQIQVNDRPPVLYLRGTLETVDEWAVAVVGTRRATAYGKQAAETIVGDLARYQITIVSGLARGIDTAAHQAALAAGGRTLAVLPCAIDRVYPPQNERLAQAIREQGALLSEYPPGTAIRKEGFFLRNRIVAGISLGVLVVEAGVQSGAFWTAKAAMDENREVFAVPGSIFSPYSRGTNSLIQNAGAKLVREAQDILDELNLSMVSQQVAVQQALPEDATEVRLLGLLGAEPVHIDEVGRAAGLAPSLVSSTLAMLELKGLVRQIGGLSFIRVG